MSRFGIAIGATVGVLLAAGAWAGEPSSKNEIARLQSADKKLALTELNNKGGPRLEAAMERRRIDNLIDRLERGQVVHPADIDQAIKRAERGRF
jgi:hypothetical protein